MLAFGNTPIDSSDVVIYSGHLLNFFHKRHIVIYIYIYWTIVLDFHLLLNFGRRISPADSFGCGSNCTLHWSYQATLSHRSCYLRNIKPNFFKGKLLISGRVERLGAEDTMMPAGITTSRILASQMSIPLNCFFVRLPATMYWWFMIVYCMKLVEMKGSIGADRNCS